MVWSLCNWSLLQLCQLNSSLPMQLIHHANWMELMLMQLIKTDPWTYSSHGTTQTWRQGSLNWTTTRTNNTPTNMSTPELNSKCFHHRPISIGYPCVWQLKMCNRINDYSPTVPSSWGLAFLLLSLTMSTTPPIILSSVSPHPDTNLHFSFSCIHQPWCLLFPNTHKTSSYTNVSNLHSGVPSDNQHRSAVCVISNTTIT